MKLKPGTEYQCADGVTCFLVAVAGGVVSVRWPDETENDIRKTRFDTDVFERRFVPLITAQTGAARYQAVMDIPRADLPVRV